MNRRRRQILDVERSIGEMRVIRISLQFAAFMMLLSLVIACTSTKFSTMYKDVTYQGHPQRFLVINTFPYSGTRRIFEDELVKALKARGMDAVVSYNVMPDPIVSDKDVLASLAKEAGADTVLINRYVNRVIDEPKTYAGSEGMASEIPTTKYIITQTDVYDMKSDRLVYSASAETRIKDGKPFVPQIETFVRKIINKLSQEGLF